jgi:hypothetical protein
MSIGASTLPLFQQLLQVVVKIRFSQRYKNDLGPKIKVKSPGDAL